MIPYYGGVRRTAGDDPENAAAILQQAMDSGFDPVQLAQLRDARKGEMEDRMAGDIATDDRADFGRQSFMRRNLENDIASDPYTGAAEHARIGGIEDTLTKAETTVRPEVDAAARQVADRNAFGDFLKKKAGYQADISPEGRQALEAETAGKIKVAEAGSGAKLASQLAMLQARGVQPGEAAKTALRSLNTIEDLAPAILQRLRQKYPGIENNPMQYGGATDTLVEKGKRALYNFGMDTRDSDIAQLEQLMRVVGARAYMVGRPNQKQYEDIVSHLGEFGFSPGADYERISKILSLSPDMRESVIAAEQPLARQVPGTGTALPPGVTVRRVQ